MDNLKPILSICITIEQLKTNVKRKERNQSKRLKYKNENPKIKRNFKFDIFYMNKSIEYLTDYRDLLIKVHKKKEEMYKEINAV